MMWGRDRTSVNPFVHWQNLNQLWAGPSRGVCPTSSATGSLSCFTAAPDMLGLPQTDMEHELHLAMLSMGMSVINHEFWLKKLPVSKAQRASWMVSTFGG